MTTQPGRAQAALAEAHAEIERWKALAQTYEVCEVEAALADTRAEVERLRALWMGAAAAHFEATQRLAEPRHCRACGRDVTVEP